MGAPARPGAPARGAAGRRPPARALALAAAALGACATARAPAAPAVLELPPEAVEVRRSDLDLAGLNEGELFAAGLAASQAGDPRRAAAAFGRLADRYPASPRRDAARLRSGLAREELGEWRAALARFLPLAAGSGPEAERAAFEAAACHHRLGEVAQARALLDGLARGDRAPAVRLRALVERGVVELEGGDPDSAERSLEAALAEWSGASGEERLDERVPAKARFWLGEVWRARFLAAPLDLSAGERELEAALEEKGRLLLQAQGHYLQAARRGSPDFGVAGVARVGELYESLHAELAAAPPPPGLDAAGAAAWRAELSGRLRVLARKALEAYQGAVDAARARGVEGDFAADAARALERVKRLLLPPGPAEPAR
jgi:tetratricopeptide (TPR) repeat protein